MRSDTAVERKLEAVRKELERECIAPEYIDRTLDELRMHFEDVRDELTGAGRSPAAAECDALARLGHGRSVARAASAYPTLKAWWKRYPYVAAFAYPLACLAVLPAVPVLAGMQHALLLGRWLLSAAAGGLVTAVLFLFLQFSLTLS